MRKGILGSIAALAAGAASAWGQGPAPISAAGGQPTQVLSSGVVPASGPSPVIMPPIQVGPPADPQGLGPTAGIGPPPGPMYPNPGPYGAPMYQPPPSDITGGGTGGYGAAPQWWFDGEYLLWFAKGQPINFPLVTTSAPGQGGVLGMPSTLQLQNADDISYGSMSGFRLSSGFFGDADRRFGALVTGFYTEQKGINNLFGTSAPFGMNSVGIPLLARPFLDTTTGSSSLVVTDNSYGTGSVLTSTTTQTWGVEASGIWNIYRSAPTAKTLCSLDLLAGYKFLQNSEALTVQSFTTLNDVRLIPILRPGPFGVPIQVGVRIVPIPIPVGGVLTGSPATVQVLDNISASNRFNGGVFGLRHEIRHGMWNVTTTGKIGIGNMHQTLNISGVTSFANPRTDRVGASYGGLYANASNIGKFNNDEFAIIPELTMNFGVNLTKSVNLFVGYNLMWISSVARPGNQVNPLIDSSTVPFSPNYGDLGRVPGSRLLFVQDDFWLTGVNFGLSVKY